MSSQESANVGPLRDGIEGGRVLFWLLGWSLAADAQTLTWDEVVDAAADAWSRAEGASLQAEVEGAEQGRRVAAAPLSVMAGTRLGSPNNQEVVAAVQAPVGLGVRARRRWSTGAEALRAEAAAERQGFVERVLDAWSAWWTAQELALHLDAWSEEVQGTLAPLDQAVDEGLAAPLDAEDLRAELAGVRAEAAAARAEAVRMAAELRTLLGAEVVLGEGGVHLHDLDAGEVANPWEALISRSVDSPEVRAAEVRAEALQAEAKAARTWHPVVQAGVALADGNGPFEPLAMVDLQVPLRPPGLAEARVARARATAERHRSRWRAERIAGAWRAEAAGFTADQERIARLERDVVAPLARRLERLEAAYRDGLVPADRVIRARRDHHEAEHERLVLIAHLRASSARAESIARLLETP